MQKPNQTSKRNKRGHCKSSISDYFNKRTKAETQQQRQGQRELARPFSS